MSENLVLEATRRAVIGKKVKQLRREGKLPAVVYGHAVEPTPIVLDLHETTKLLRAVGSSTLINLKVDGEEYAVLLRELQKGIISRKYTHLDFMAIALDQLVRTQVPVVILDADVPAVREFGAMVVTGVDSLDIECLPNILPEKIEVDASILESIGDNVMVRDLSLAEGITVYDDPDTMIVVATAPSEITVEEEEEDLEGELLEEDADGEPEIIDKGKAEEEGEDA
jgi:large subunit ribosomal protein L25